MTSGVKCDFCLKKRCQDGQNEIKMGHWLKEVALRDQIFTLTVIQYEYFGYFWRKQDHFSSKSQRKKLQQQKPHSFRQTLEYYPQDSPLINVLKKSG